MSGTRGNVLMVVHSYCPADPRVRREAEALAEDGWGVDVLCLKNRGQSFRETIRGVRYLRFPLRRRRGGVVRYAFEYGALLVLGMAAAVVLHGARRYRLVQAHNMPDFLVFVGAVPWLTGVPMLLDMHDPIPELYRSKFGFADSAPLIRFLTAMEGVCVAFADHCLAATGAFRDRLIGRGRPAGKITVLLNSPDAKLFSPRPAAANVATAAANGSAPTLLFHGTVTERSGVDCAIRAVERVRDDGVDARFIVLGDGDYLDEVRRLAAEGDRASWLDVRGGVPLDRVPDVIAGADLGVVPNRPGPFHDLALPTRILEYLAMEVPVVTARSPAVSALFGDDDLLFFQPGDEDDLVRALRQALGDGDCRRRCVENGARVAGAHAWDREKRIYLDVVTRLTSSARPSAMSSR